MIEVPKTLRVFFVQFYYQNHKTVDGQFMVSAETKEDAKFQVERMITNKSAYIPPWFDKYRIE